MSLEIIHLRKSLYLLYLPKKDRTAALRSDIREERRRELGEDNGGGDFHSPFWTDAKEHVGGNVELEEQSYLRIKSNGRRARLYPLLTKGFLTWWNDKRRWRNEPFEVVPQRVKARFQLPEIDVVVKVENVLALKIGGQDNRIIYPYFSEAPVLSDEAARLGLWLMGEALTAYKVKDMRMLDILRGQSFGAVDVPLQGNERALFVLRYAELLQEREALLEEYQ